MNFKINQILKINVILIITGLLAACSSVDKNLDFAQSKTMINNDQEIIKIYDGVCNQFKADTKKIYGCGIGLSADLKLSKSKAVLDAKVAVADIVSSTIVKKESQISKETDKGTDIKYNSEESNEILEQSINQYKVVFNKTYTEGKDFRTFIVIEYKLEVWKNLLFY